jgi:hypothetical protein
MQACVAGAQPNELGLDPRQCARRPVTPVAVSPAAAPNAAAIGYASSVNRDNSRNVIHHIGRSCSVNHAEFIGTRSVDLHYLEADFSFCANALSCAPRLSESGMPTCDWFGNSEFLAWTL